MRPPDYQGEGPRLGADSESVAADRHGAPLCWDVPPIAHKSNLFGPIARSLMRRTSMVWLSLCILGAIPSLLAATTDLKIPVALQALGWGLWLPGAGFVALGGTWMLLFPLALLVFVLSFLAWLLAGAAVLPPIVWLVAAIAAGALAGDAFFSWTWLIVPALSAAIFAFQIYSLRRNYRIAAELGARRSADLPRALAALDTVAKPAPRPDSRELTPEELAAARYLFDRALQPTGQFDGFTRVDNFQLAGLRYQLNYISYGLAMLQRKYTPNFHGYLNQAQRYAIESLTSPEVCGYWKFENAWGNLTLNPDPIGTRDDIMLTGLSLPALTAYADNTGDLRYQHSNALQFMPFKGRDAKYGHNAQSFVESIVWNWKHAVYFLYPCEPHWVFPICNAYALCGVKPYDRVNGTAFAASVYDAFMHALEEEFVTPDGGLQPELSALTGISPFWSVQQMQMDNLLSVSQVFNAIHPGYAKRWYVLVRDGFLELTPDGLTLKNGDWSDCTDFGNYQRNPGMALGSIALAAREHGDDVTAEAALAKADQLLQPLGTKGVFAYAGISNTANINLAVARWSRRNDWLDTINYGPSPGARSGPILNDCGYPDVLVARAVSDGKSLDLVLYDGQAAGHHVIKVERLEPGRTYDVQGAKPASLIAPPDGVVTLGVELHGRTEVMIRLAEAATV